MAELSIVVPTLNEVENIRPLLERLQAVMAGIDYEVIFVDDDSRDGTAALVRSISLTNPRVRVIHRINRRGLSSAALEGMLASSAPYLALLDADLQHDVSILPVMYRKLGSGDLDIVVGSRHVPDGSMGGFEAKRVALSNIGRHLSRLVCAAELSDPMSGYFVLTRTFLEQVMHRVSTIGFKILLDLLASSPHPVRFAEVGYRFGRREHGESKLDVIVGVEYIELLLDKVIGEWIPTRYVLFAAVGAVGVVVNHAINYALVTAAGFAFAGAQALAGLIVIGINFILNNHLSFRSHRLRGSRFWIGMALFYLACSIGLLTNVSLSRLLVDAGAKWYVAGLAGVVIGSVWNFWMSSLFVWRVNARRRRKAVQVEIARTSAANA